VRRAVFIVEQGVPEELEWDADDPVATHALALTADGQPVGTGRLLPDGHIGRMAVSAAWRRRGVGQAILRWLIDCARARGDAAAHLHAQTHALGFYARAGFIAHGAVFMEAGIPHRAMSLSL
jgi:predicted GNAT family N-acyltransferase